MYVFIARGINFGFYFWQYHRGLDWRQLIGLVFFVLNEELKIQKTPN